MPIELHSFYLPKNHHCIFQAQFTHYTIFSFYLYTITVNLNFNSVYSIMKKNFNENLSKNWLYTQSKGIRCYRSWNAVTINSLFVYSLFVSTYFSSGVFPTDAVTVDEIHMIIFTTNMYWLFFNWCSKV